MHETTDVFEQTLIIEKKGRASIAGDRILLTIEEEGKQRHFFCNLPIAVEQERKEILIPQKKKYKLREGFFENDIVKKVKESYCIRFDKEAIKEISIFINEYPQSILSSDSFRDKIKPILQKYGYKDLHDAIPAYTKYFLIDGLLKKNGSVFEIVRSNLIPKNKVDVNRGFLDELNMS
jgi:hypothetical protein